MNKKKFVKFFLFFFIICLIIFAIIIKLRKNNEEKEVKISSEDISYNSNIIKDVEYTTKDKDDNEYFIKAAQGEIDFSNSNIIF